MFCNCLERVLKSTPTVDEEKMVQYIVEVTGYSEEAVYEILDAELRYMIGLGLAK